MAIGDAVAVFLGTAATNRQPSSGVEEQISFLTKTGSTDAPSVYDGSNVINIVAAAFNPSTTTNSWVNMGLMIDNSIYLRKPGTTDRLYAGGVQTNA
jgi:hypothetical protein